MVMFLEGGQMSIGIILAGLNRKPEDVGNVSGIYTVFFHSAKMENMFF